MDQFIIVESLKSNGNNTVNVYSVVTVEEYVGSRELDHGFDYKAYPCIHSKKEAVKILIQKTFPRFAVLIRYSGMSNIVCRLTQEKISKSII